MAIQCNRGCRTNVLEMSGVGKGRFNLLRQMSVSVFQVEIGKLYFICLKPTVNETTPLM